MSSKGAGKANTRSPFIFRCHLTQMVDVHAEQMAHKTEGCPACRGLMNLVGDTYACEKCGHFRQDPTLQSILERQNPENLKFCKCEYCLKHEKA